jgi:ABC-type uncharacterized transport system auxiliary subunit
MIDARLRTLGRLPARFWIAGLLCLAAGCTPLATAYWVYKDGKTDPPEFRGLKNKKVAILCRGPADNRFRQLEAGVPNQVSKRLGTLLKEQMKKRIKLVPTETVEKYSDENEWSEFTAAGRDLGAEMVVAIDIQSLSIRYGGSVYRANAEIEVNVYDMTDDGQIVYTKRFDAIDFPPELGGIPADHGMSQRGFVDLFVNYVSRDISELFLDHDHRSRFGSYGLKD